MATSSFDQKFVVRDKKVADELKAEIKNTAPSTVPAKDVSADKEKALELFRRASSN